MALVLAQILGASESEATLAVFHSLRRSSAQRDAISEAARITLSENGNALLGAILTVHKSTEADRNDLTHGHFGTYTELSDGIIWMTTNAYVDFKARMELAHQTFTTEVARDLRSKLYFYKKPDLERILENIKETAWIWHDFVKYLRAREPAREVLYCQLCARPRIQEALVLQNRGTNPASLP